MQRIVRMPIEHFPKKTQDIFARYEELIKPLKYQLPPSTIQIFASPKVVDNQWVEWYSELEGQPHLFDRNVQSAHLQQVQEKIQQRLNHLKQWLNHNQAQGTITAEQAFCTEQLIQSAQAPNAIIYEINGEPVIVGWGQEPAPAPVPKPVARKNHRCCWLALLALLALLAMLAAWYFLWQLQEVPVEMPKEPVPKVEVEKVPAPPQTAESKIEPVKEPEPQIEAPAKVETPAPIPPAPKDKIVQRLEEIGAKVKGDLRATLSWSNANDLDLELNTLTAQNCRNSYAELDVDMNGASPCGGKRSFDAHRPIENIIIANKKKMPDGNYSFYVQQFGAHQMRGGGMCHIVKENAGFQLQIQLNNEIKTFAYDKLLGRSLCLKRQRMLGVKKQGDKFILDYINPNLKLISTRPVAAE